MVGTVTSGHTFGVLARRANEAAAFQPRKQSRGVRLEEAQTAGKLAQRMKTLTYPAVLVVDEIGYLPVSRTGAMLFFCAIAFRWRWCIREVPVG